MIEYRTAQSAQSKVLEHFRRRSGRGRGQNLHNVAYFLLERILSQHDFGDVGSLTRFCAEPENLQSWLPSEVDRIVFSDGLVEGLREFSDNPS